MSAAPSDIDIAATLLAKQGLQLRDFQVIQALWAGYGHVYHATADSIPSSTSSNPEEQNSFVIKIITPPASGAGNEGHRRKLLSYQVEQYFYTHLAPSMPPSIPVAQCFASIAESHAEGTITSAVLLSDLRQKFPVAGEKRGFLTPTQVHSSLDWLSSFHGFWWPRAKYFNRASLVRPPLEEEKGSILRTAKPSVWLNGGYTYLATRRSEYESLLADLGSEWREPLTKPTQYGRSYAELAAQILAPRADRSGPTDAYQTLIHGDVKSENLFTTASGDSVAFYDFQYTGLGLGVCDLAKFFTCSVPLHMLIGGGERIPSELGMLPSEHGLLQKYLSNLKAVSGKEYDFDVFQKHWETALVDWLRFQASWGFWGNTEWLEARVRWILKDEGWQNYVGSLDERSQ
jgi:hypothetical protein